MRYALRRARRDEDMVRMIERAGSKEWRLLVSDKQSAQGRHEEEKSANAGESLLVRVYGAGHACEVSMAQKHLLCRSLRGSPAPRGSLYPLLRALALFQETG